MGIYYGHKDPGKLLNPKDKVIYLANRKLIVGVDEAGYGPNLGPLTLAASIWEVDARASEEGVVSAFSERFRAKVAVNKASKAAEHVPLGDSKKLYDRSKGIESLELGLLAMAEYANGSTPETLGQFVDLVSAFDGCSSDGLPPWYTAGRDLPLPLEAERSRISGLSSIASESLKEHGVSLVGLVATVVPEPVFNQSLTRLGSKGLLLSQATLQLVTRIVEATELPVECFCDRQGGRKNYLPVLLDAFPDAWFMETAQETKRSSYRCDEPSLDVHFSVGGDSFPPTALASMLAKYLRERFMEAFNAFWKSHLPNIKATAGYPVDAKRFADEIRATARTLEIAPELWWREK